MTEFARNHYVPQWYQHRFIPPARKQKKFHYLDLKPETIVSNGHRYTRNAILRWGPPSCFCHDHLYTTRFGDWQSTEIEEKFFGPVDDEGKRAVDFFGNFEYADGVHENLQPLLRYMSLQKLRTPKGLLFFASETGSTDKNELLMLLQDFQQMFCAIWTECVWSIVDASESDTKFIVSDHPVTVYNSGCFPASKYCQGFRDPDIRKTGTHTLFPLSLDKMLILTNLSWLRDPYGDPIKARPNANYFRGAIMKFTTFRQGECCRTKKSMKSISLSKAERIVTLLPPKKNGYSQRQNFRKGDGINWETDIYCFLIHAQQVLEVSSLLDGTTAGRLDQTSTEENRVSPDFVMRRWTSVSGTLFMLFEASSPEYSAQQGEVRASKWAVVRSPRIATNTTKQRWLGKSRNQRMHVSESAEADSAT